MMAPNSTSKKVHDVIEAATGTDWRAVCAFFHSVVNDRNE